MNYVAENGLDLKLVCLSFLSTEITGMNYHRWFSTHTFPGWLKSFKSWGMGGREPSNGSMGKGLASKPVDL